MTNARMALMDDSAVRTAHLHVSVPASARRPRSLTLWEPSGEGEADAQSPFCLKVQRALALLGLRYERRHAPMPSDLGSLSRPSGGVNPAAQGPVLVVDGHAVSDSTTILKTLDELRPGVLVPLDPKRAAEAWIFEELADRSLNGFVVAARWADPLNFSALQDAYFGRAPWFVRTFILPRVREQVLAGLVARDVTREGLAATWSEMRRVLDALEERAPYEGWWMGTDEPTVADLGLFGQLHALRSPLTPAQARELVRRPKLTDWLDRVDERTRATRAGATEVPL